MDAVQDAGAGGFRPYDPSKGGTTRPPMGTAPVEFKKESGSQEVRAPASSVGKTFSVAGHMARISSFLSHAADMMSSMPCQHPAIQRLPIRNVYRRIDDYDLRHMCMRRRPCRWQ